VWLSSGFQSGRAAKWQSCTAVMPVTSFSHAQSACPFLAPGAAERRSHNATPGPFHTCKVHASFSHRMWQSSKAAMLPWVAYKHMKRMPFAHIGCGRAAKPQCHVGLLSHACAQCEHWVQQCGTATLLPRVFSNVQSMSCSVHRLG
jgi:hypothetical protein